MDHARLVEAIRAGDAETAAAEAAGYPFLCRPEPVRRPSRSDSCAAGG